MFMVMLNRMPSRDDGSWDWTSELVTHRIWQVDGTAVVDSTLWISGAIRYPRWLEARTVRFLACVAILYFVLLVYSPPDYSPGNTLERRDHHLDLKLTFLQHWDLQGGVQASFIPVFKHLWDHLRPMGRVFPKCLWAGNSQGPRVLKSWGNPCPSNSQCHCFSEGRLAVGLWRGSLHPFSCHFDWLVLKMQPHRGLFILYVIRSDFA